MLRLQAARYLAGPLINLLTWIVSPDAAQREPLTWRFAMTSWFTTLVVTLALALAATTTVSFAQSRPQSCIPHYDSSGAQVAPYC
jgi:hypothetical protein